jgi:methionyl-tRNA synthetase
MTHDDIDQAFQALHDAQRAAFLLSMRLHAADDDAGATDAQNRADRLQNEIGNLVNKELDAWQAGAEAVIPQLNRAATAAQAAVDQAKSDVANAQKVSAAMQALDKAVDLAIKFVG